MSGIGSDEAARQKFHTLWLEVTNIRDMLFGGINFTIGVPLSNAGYAIVLCREKGRTGDRALGDYRGDRPWTSSLDL